MSKQYTFTDDENHRNLETIKWGESHLNAEPDSSHVALHQSTHTQKKSKWVNSTHSLTTRGLRIQWQSNEAKTFDCRIRLQPPCAPPVWSHGGQTEWKLVRKEVGLRAQHRSLYSSHRLTSISITPSPTTTHVSCCCHLQQDSALSLPWGRNTLAPSTNLY